MEKFVRKMETSMNYYRKEQMKKLLSIGLSAMIGAIVALLVTAVLR